MKEAMKEKLIDLLGEARVGIGLFKLSRYFSRDTLAAIADHLLNNGVLVPPVKLGDNVYAAIGAPFADEPCVEEWTVKGVAYDGKWYIKNIDEEFFELGDELCKLTREEAERCLERK